MNLYITLNVRLASCPLQKLKMFIFMFNLAQNHSVPQRTVFYKKKLVTVTNKTHWFKQSSVDIEESS